MASSIRVIAIVAFLLTSLTACGGGGGGVDGGSASPPNNPPANQAPTANAGTDQSVDEGSMVNLSGAGTDSDGSVTAYSWQQDSGPTVTITNANTASASFTAPTVAASENLVFRLTVTDDDGATGTDTTTVTVNDVPPVNQAPTASNSTLLLDEGTTVASQLNASDPDGNALTYAVVTTPSSGILQVNTQTGSFEYSADVGSPGADSFTFLVNDGQLDSPEATVSITINRTPQVSNGSLTVVEGDTVSSTLVGSDADGDPVTFSIVQGPVTGTLDVDSQTGDFSFTADLDSEGTETFIFVCSDGRLDSLNGTVTIVIEPRRPIEVAKLVEPEAGEGNSFGFSVDISGDRAIVGAPEFFAQGEYVGAAYIYARNENGEWSLEARLQPNNATSEELHFGKTVRILGNTALVTSTTNDSGGSLDSGYVYVFENNGAKEWLQQAKLAPSDHTFGDSFAYGAGPWEGIGISNDTIVVGAPGKNAETIGYLGAVYIFDRDEFGNWSETAIFQSPNPQEFDYFGDVVEIDGDTVVVSATRSGGVYVFNRDQAGNWLFAEQLIFSVEIPGPQIGNRSLSLEEGTLFVNATQAVFCADTRYECGGAIVFERDSSGAWLQREILTGNLSERTEYFGRSVALEGEWAVVGAPAGGATPQSVYLYFRELGASWTEQVELMPSDPQEDAWFGNVLSISSGFAIVGAPRHDGSFLDSGAAYIIDLR